MRKGYLPAIILGVLIFAGVVYAATQHPPCYNNSTTAPGGHQDCYSVDKSGTNVSIVKETTYTNGQQCLTNNNSLDIFVPTKTSAEWSSFYSYASNVAKSTLNSDGSCGGAPGCNAATVQGGGNQFSNSGPNYQAQAINIAVTEAKSNVDKVSVWSSATKTNAKSAIDAAQWGSLNSHKEGAVVYGSDGFFWETDTQYTQDAQGGAGTTVSQFDALISVTKSCGRSGEGNQQSCGAGGQKQGINAAASQAANQVKSGATAAQVSIINTFLQHFYNQSSNNYSETISGYSMNITASAVKDDDVSICGPNGGLGWLAEATFTMFP